MKEKLIIIEKLFKNNLLLIEQEYAIKGGLTGDQCRYLREIVEVPLLFDLDKLSREANVLLQSANLISYTDWKNQKEKINWENNWKKINTIPEIRERYPKVTTEYYLNMYSETTNLILKNEYKTAIKQMRYTSDIEHIASILMIMGRFEEADEITQHSLKNSLWLVKAIELMRYDRVLEALELLKKSGFEEDIDVFNSYLAKGFCKIEPWLHYPWDSGW